MLSQEYGRKLSYKEAAHAQTKNQYNTTSGRVARAYQTMFPRFRPGDRFFELSFRYLSPGSEGEKCRPLDHT